MAAKKLNFYGEKRYGSQKTEFLWRKKATFIVENTKFRFLSEIRLSKIRNSDFCKKFDFFFQFFHRSSAKPRRTDKRPTALNSLLKMLTIPIIFYPNQGVQQLAKYANNPHHFLENSKNGKK